MTTMAGTMIVLGMTAKAKVRRPRRAQRRRVRRKPGSLSPRLPSRLLRETLVLPAELRFDADRVAEVSPQVSGRIIKLYAGEGDVVSKGRAACPVVQPRDC